MLFSLITDEAQRMAKRTVVDGEFDLYTYHRHNEVNLEFYIQLLIEGFHITMAAENRH